MQSRYYNPEWGRFLNADSFVSTGQGLLGNNMFAYCANCPINRADPYGYFHMVLGVDEDSLTHSSLQQYVGASGGGGGTWDSLKSCMQNAAVGLSMAGGEKTGVQKHHFLSNKNKKYKQLFQDVTDPYGLNLDEDWNTATLKKHTGRHTDAYHKYMLEMIHIIDGIAQGSTETFLEGFEILSLYIIENTWLLYAR